jgi:galactokinase
MIDDARRCEKARSRHRVLFAIDPDAITFAPGRVNLIGEHTDYNGGNVLPMAIDMGTTCAASRRTDDRYGLHSHQVNGPIAQVDPATFDRTAANGWLGYVVGALAIARERGWFTGGVDLSIDADLPLGAGLSSSASLECAVLTALIALGDAEVTAMQVALAAQQVEHEYAHVPCGIMDQAVSMLAKSGHALLLDSATLESQDVPLHLDRLGLQVLLIDTNVRHDLADGAYADRRAACERAATALGVAHLAEIPLGEIARIDALPDPEVRRARHVITEQARVSDAVRAFEVADAGELGRAFAGSHTSLSRDYEVSCPELDIAVSAAIVGGAAAARMTGGGFGGNVVTLCRPDAVARVQASVREALTRDGLAAPTFRIVSPAGGARRIDGSSPGGSASAVPAVATEPPGGPDGH